MFGVYVDIMYNINLSRIKTLKNPKSTLLFVDQRASTRFDYRNLKMNKMGFFLFLINA